MPRERGHGAQVQDRLIRTFIKMFILCFCVLCMSHVVLLRESRNVIDLDSIKPNDGNESIHSENSNDINNAGNIHLDANTRTDSKNKVKSEQAESLHEIDDIDNTIKSLQEIDPKQNEQPQEKTKDKEEGSSYLTMYGEHRVKPALEKLPKWLSDYFAWHQEQVANANDETKYLVVACIGNEKCGGFSDRLRTLPFHLLAASKVKRVLCIYWSKPFGLEHLLKPPKGGMDWRCPAVFDSMVDKSQKTSLQKKFQHNKLFGPESKRGDNAITVAETIITKIKKNNDVFTSIGLKDQDFQKINKLNNVFNAYSYRERMPAASHWFHVDLSEHIYRVMFEPVEPIGQMMNATMTRLGLVENNYTAVHVRARYPVAKMHAIVGGNKRANDHDTGNHVHPFEGAFKEYLLNIANNALECGTLLDRDSQLFFASDSINLTEYVIKNPIMIGKDKKSNNPGRTYQPIGIDQREEIKHLAADHHPDVDHSDFYPIIEDLLIMGGSRCVSHGIGSFGAFGAGFSGNRCRAVHRNFNGRVAKCPNWRELKSIVNVTDGDLMFGDKVSDSDGRLDPVLG